MPLIRSLLLASCLMAFVMATCRQNQEPGIPAPIQARIDSIRRQPAWNPPARVEEYEYQGKRVYLFTAPCCDQFIQVFDENGALICAPSGGYTGKGDGQCPDFFDKSVKKRVIFEDKRGGKSPNG